MILNCRFILDAYISSYCARILGNRVIWHNIIYLHFTYYLDSWSEKLKDGPIRLFPQTKQLREWAGTLQCPSRIVQENPFVSSHKIHIHVSVNLSKVIQNHVYLFIRKQRSRENIFLGVVLSRYYAFYLKVMWCRFTTSSGEIW